MFYLSRSPKEISRYANFPQHSSCMVLRSIKNRVLFVAIAVIVIGGSAAFGLNYALRPVSAAADSGRSHSGQQDLAAALNPDGSLRVGTGAALTRVATGWS